MLFYREMRAFSGGHLKVFDYFEHVRAARGFEARIAFGEHTVWDASNPWLDWRERAVPAWSPDRGDVLFLAGVDWRVALARGVRESRKPVINLIQHVRHADPGQDVYPFLSERAVRVCVSPEVAEAIQATGRVCGPVLTIPNGIALPPRQAAARPASNARQPVLVVGTKNQALAVEVAARLRDDGVAVELHDRFVPRAEFLDRLGRHAITVFCPDPSEGFYLPALEGMNRGTLVICPDCVGNRSFCIDERTAIVPEPSAAAMVAAVHRGLALSTSGFEALRDGAAAMAARHTLDRERARFHEVLAGIDDLWSPAEPSMPERT